MEEPTQKQQISEILRNGSSFIVTSGKNPNLDEQAAVIALAQILQKLDKRVEAVVAEAYPQSLEFLETALVKDKFQGLRDFVIELDTSQVEADKLKYIPEGKKLKIYITPYRGNFKKEHVDTSYGDYHTDAVIALGSRGKADLDKSITDKSALLSKAKIIAINAAKSDTGTEPGTISWSEESASSVCEMLMSLTESLQGGLLDRKIATSLLTGIISATNHFTETNTTPKVMTMAAQLMAAGADQATIIKNLESKPKPEPPKPQKSNNELVPSIEKKIPHKEKEISKPQTNYEKPKPEPKPELKPVPERPAPSAPPQPAEPPKPASHVPEANQVQAPKITDFHHGSGVISDSQKGRDEANQAAREEQIEAARKAVEEAAKRSAAAGNQAPSSSQLPPTPPPPPSSA